ncbi:MAG: ComEC/Rec2 family competence protein [Spirochaetaceae bacterium]|jgi:competence protein ComEC|nr:ComEC/Rec2 family competence protein [Spirochaetaceae bacterium]
MVTRKIFPPLCAAALACAVSYYGLFALEQLGLAPPPRIFAALPLAAGIFLAFFKIAGAKKIPFYAAGFCLGLALGINAHSAAYRAALPPGGLPAGEIRGLEGVLLEDPRSVQARGQGMGRLALAKIYGKNGIQVIPGGKAAQVRVIFDEEALPRIVDFGRKSVLYVEGSFSGAFFRAEGVHVLSPPPPIERARTAFRLTLLEKFSRHEWGFLAQAVLLGVRDNLDTELARAFTVSGCAHVLALSGMHLGVIAGLFSLLLKKPLGLKGASLSGALLVSLYVYLVGPQASLIRSLIMYLTGVLVILKGFPRRAEAILGGAFIIQLLLFPSSGRELSFALSYLALLGLLTLGPWIYELIRGTVPRPVAAPLSASTGAFLITAPLSAFCFGVLHPVGILAALIMGPLITLFMVLALAWLFVEALFPAAAVLLAALLSFVYLILKAVSAVAGLFPAITIRDARAALIVSLAVMTLIYVGQKKLALMRKRLEPFDQGA